MKILVACEESQRVCTAFRAKGHEAYSCDIVDCSGGHREWHIKHDVLSFINGNCMFKTQDGMYHGVRKWDMILAFPPCTHLAVSGARYFEDKRIDGRQQKGIEFFCKFFEADCEKIAIENPVNIISGEYVKKWFPEIAEKYNLPRKPTQIIQPYMFGHPESKKTCLWLKGLPVLTPTDNLDLPSSGIWENQTKDKQNKLIVDGKWISYNDPRTAKERSKTYTGIAEAMADQWG